MLLQCQGHGMTFDIRTFVFAFDTRHLEFFCLAPIARSIRQAQPSPLEALPYSNRPRGQELAHSGMAPPDPEQAALLEWTLPGGSLHNAEKLNNELPRRPASVAGLAYLRRLAPCKCLVESLK